MDTTFLDSFRSTYEEKLVSAGFCYEQATVNVSAPFSGKILSIMTIPHSSGDLLHIEEMANEKTGNNPDYKILFSLNTMDEKTKTERCIHYLSSIFNIDFNYIEMIYDNYIKAGLDIGLFVHNGIVEFNPSLLLNHYEASSMKDSSSLALNNVNYKEIIVPLVKSKKLIIKFKNTLSFEEGRFAVTFQLIVVFFDQSTFIFYGSGEDYILVYEPNGDGTTVLTPEMLHPYFCEYFKDRIANKFIGMDIDLTTITPELFKKYVDIIDMSNI